MRTAWATRNARKWLHTMRRSPRVRFFFYTRSWRVAAIRAVTGFSATVFQCNLFALPPSVEAFLALPEVFDSAEGAIRSLEMVP